MSAAPISHPRRAVAIGAAAVGIAICDVPNHVHVSLTHPSTYSSPPHHKCGLVMLGCISWAVCEIFLRAQSGHRSRFEEPK